MSSSKLNFLGVTVSTKKIRATSELYLRRESLIFYSILLPKLGMQGLNEVLMSVDYEKVEMLQSCLLTIEERLSQWFLLWRLPWEKIPKWQCLCLFDCNELIR